MSAHTISTPIAIPAPSPTTRLVRTIPGIEITTVEACSAHDGTWAMKVENFELSQQWGERACSGMTAAGATVNTADNSQTPQAVMNRLRRRLPAVDVVLDVDCTRRSRSR